MKHVRYAAIGAAAGLLLSAAFAATLACVPSARSAATAALLDVTMRVALSIFEQF